jgi:hypothetical protein
VYVRLFEGDYRSLATDAGMFEKSVPDKVREGYFKVGCGVAVLMTREAQRALMAALDRVGNSVNQFAQHLNGGGRSVFTAELRNVQQEMRS